VYGDGTTADFYSPHNTYSYGSSKRWKKNIVQIEGALAKILQVRGVEYDVDGAVLDSLYPQVGKKKREFTPDSHDIGIIAEELREIYPEMTIVDPKDENFCVGIMGNRLIPVLIEAIKELKSQVDDLGGQLGKKTK